MEVALTVALLAFCYFLPTIIAATRGHQSVAAIFVVNILAGWTGRFLKTTMAALAALSLSQVHSPAYASSNPWLSADALYSCIGTYMKGLEGDPRDHCRSQEAIFCHSLAGYQVTQNDCELYLTIVKNKVAEHTFTSPADMQVYEDDTKSVHDCIIKRQSGQRRACVPELMIWCLDAESVRDNHWKLAECLSDITLGGLGVLGTFDAAAPYLWDN